MSFKPWDWFVWIIGPNRERSVAHVNGKQIRSSRILSRKYNCERGRAQWIHWCANCVTVHLMQVFMFLLIKVDSYSKDQFNFIASALKRLFSQLDPWYESGLLTLQYGAGFVAREWLSSKCLFNFSWISIQYNGNLYFELDVREQNKRKYLKAEGWKTDIVLN